MKRLLVLFTIIIIISIGFYLYYREGRLAVNKNDKTSKIFVIKKGNSLNTIANNLANEGLIRNKIIFYLIVKQMGLETKIQAGDFRLSPSFDIYQIIKELTHGTLDVWVTIIEGLRKEEIAQIINRNLDVPESEFLKFSKEGYLFPDTYLIPKDATSSSIVNIFLNNFNKRYSENISIGTLKNGLTPSQIVVLASLIEREAKFDQDRQIVANILLKRSRHDWPLQVDATVQYVLGYQPESKSWWKQSLNINDLETDSPLNTYKNKGLPPEPICNPGLASLKAAAMADGATPYWYYLSDTKGKMHYAKTLEEHNENVRKYIK